MMRGYTNIPQSKKLAKIDINSTLNEERVCGSCNWSCCNPLEEECKYHPINKDRWCHKHNKSVFNLEDARNCKEYFD